MLEILKPFLTADFVGKMVRTAIQSMTAGLVTHGVLTGDDQQQLVGAIGLIASIAWTAFAHAQASANAPAPAVPANNTIGGLQ